MNKFGINEPVYVVGNPETIGFIQRIDPDSSGQIFYGVTFQNGNYSTHPELQLRKFLPSQNAWQFLAANLDNILILCALKHLNI